MAHETSPSREGERGSEGRKAAFQNRFLAQDIVHDREMASQRDEGGGEARCTFTGQPV